MAYSDEQRDMVYRIWAFSADRNAEKTARLVNADEDCREVGISDLTSRTVRYWVDEFDWRRRATSELHALAPHLRFNAQAALALAAPLAAVALREALESDCMVDRTFLLKDADGNQRLETRREVDPKLVQLKVNAAQLVLDRTGFSPVGTRETGRLDLPPEMITDLSRRLEDAKGDSAKIEEISSDLFRRLGIGTISA